VRKGFIKLWRTWLEDPTVADPVTFRVFCILLGKAAHRPTQVKIGNKVVELQRGQLITSRDSLHAAFHAYQDKSATKRSPSALTLWRTTKRLEKAGILNSQSTPNFTIISMICQESSLEVEQQAEQQNEETRTQRRISKKEKRLYLLPSKSQEEDICVSPPKKKRGQSNAHYWRRLEKACAEVDHLFPWSARSFQQSARRQGYRLDVIAHALEQLAKENPLPTGRDAENYCMEIIRKEGKSTRYGAVGYKFGVSV
jgi:hypothetical protein